MSAPTDIQGTVAASVLPTAFEDAVRAALAAFPEEGCGVLLGRAGRERRIDAAVALPNVAACGRDRAFAMAPGDIQAAARRRGGDILGFFHSHPRARARPSADDIRHASAWPGYLHLIVGLPRPGEYEIGLFQVTETGWEDIMPGVQKKW